MKKIFLIVMLFTVAVTFGQDKYQMKKINYFVDSAEKEFSLDKKQTKELLDVRTTYFNDYQKVFKAAKSGEITEDEKKKQSNEVNQKFNKYFSELVGKNWSELKPFFERIQEEMKNI